MDRSYASATWIAASLYEGISSCAKTVFHYVAEMSLRTRKKDFFPRGLNLNTFFPFSITVIYAKRKFVSFCHIFTFTHVYWEYLSFFANVALTLWIAINGTFSMNILYAIMQRNTTKNIYSTSEKTGWQENRKEGKCFQMFAFLALLVWEIVSHKVPSKILRLEAHGE